MTEFKDAITKGLDASEAADKNFREILSVFKALNEAISDASDQKAKVNIKQRKPRSSSLVLPQFFREESSREITVQTLAWKDRFLEIVALPSNYVVRRIAKIETSAEGYPVEITDDDFSDSCLDKESLEERLKVLFSSPNAGSAIKKAMVYADKVRENNKT